MMFYNIVRPVLTKNNILTTKAVLDINLASQAGRDDFIPVGRKTIDNQKMATSFTWKIRSYEYLLVKADGYIKISHEK